jgi:hypothetical protein
MVPILSADQRSISPEFTQRLGYLQLGQSLEK